MSAILKKYNKSIVKPETFPTLSALQSYAADTLNVFPHLLPVDFHIKYAVRCTVKLNESGCRIAESYGLSNILDEESRKLWEFPAYYIRPKPSSKRNFAMKFLARTKWKTSDMLQVYDTALFSGRSKMVFVRDEIH